MALEDQMFELVGSRQFGSASKLLKENPGMNINTLNKSGCSLYIMAVRMSNRTPDCYDFIETVLSHPKFIHHNTTSNTTKNTPFFEALNTSNVLLIKTILKYQASKSINIISNKDQLMFEKVALFIKEIEGILEESSERDEVFEAMLESQKEILILLRAPSIRHAIVQDDLAMLKKLADLGANLHKPLADGVDPRDLSTPKTNPKSHTWLTQHVKEKIESSPEYRINKLREAKEAFEKERAQKQKEMMSAHIAQRKENISMFFGITTPAEKNNMSTPQDKMPMPKPNPNNNLLFKKQELEKQLENANKQYMEDKNKLMHKSLNEREELMNNVLNLKKK